MNRRTPGLPIHHQLPESTQTLDHQVGDAIQPSHPLSPPSPPALNLSQHKKKNRKPQGGGKLNRMEISNILEKMLLFKLMVIKMLTELRKR